MNGWQAVNLLAGAGLGAAWLYSAFGAWLGVREMAELAKPEFAVPDGTKLPRVSIVVPARNEEAMIEAAIRSLLAIDYPDFELLVVNDRSEDATGEILERLKAEDARLRVTHVRELPSGWLGKTHAMWMGGKMASGEWLLFSDADVVHAPEALRRAVYYAEQEQASHMVLLPSMRMETLGERMMIPFFEAMFIFMHRPWKVRDPQVRDTLGVGAFNLVRRETYEKIGTYESMRLSVVDDIELGAKIKRAGFACRAALGDGLLSVRWAIGARGVIQNLTKNFFAQMRYNLGFALLAAAGLLWLQLGPWIGTIFAPGWTRAGYALALSSLLAVHVGIARRTGSGAAGVLLHPVACVLMVFTLLRSTMLTLRNGGVEWRGTFYPLADLRNGRG